jgi:hypothetical protein
MKLPILRPLIFTTSILLIPLVAMQFTSEVNWTLFDFIAMGVLLLGTSLAFEFFLSRTSSMKYRVAAGLAIGTCLLLTWMNLAVGIIGNENNPANLLYFAVPMILFLGAIYAEFEAKALARVLFMTAGALALIPIIALVVNRPSIATSDALFGVLAVLLLNTFFVVLLVGSGLLFKQAAKAALP